MRNLLLLLPLAACSSSMTPPSAPPGAVSPEEQAPVSKPAEPAGAESASAIFEGQIEFVSLKNGDSPVPGTIRGITGSSPAVLGDDGVTSLGGVVTIPLTAIDTALEIRDQRVMDTFFHAQETPTASLELKQMKLPSSDAGGMWIDGTLQIGPFAQDVRGHFRGERQEDGSWSIESGEPMIVSISSLGMGERLMALMTLCGHKSIDDSVEVRAKGIIRF